MLGQALSTPPPASTTNVTASSGTSSPRDSVDRALPIAQREGLCGPPVVPAGRRWAATAAIILLLTLLRSLNLCVVAMLGLTAFLQSSPVAPLISPIRRG